MYQEPGVGSSKAEGQVHQYRYPAHRAFRLAEGGIPVVVEESVEADLRYARRIASKLQQDLRSLTPGTNTEQVICHRAKDLRVRIARRPLSTYDPNADFFAVGPATLTSEELFARLDSQASHGG